jgi:hypothetical protein
VQGWQGTHEQTICIRKLGHRYINFFNLIQQLAPIDLLFSLSFSFLFNGFPPFSPNITGIRKTHQYQSVSSTWLNRNSSWHISTKPNMVTLFNFFLMSMFFDVPCLPHLEGISNWHSWSSCPKRFPWCAQVVLVKKAACVNVLVLLQDGFLLRLCHFHAE